MDRKRFFWISTLVLMIIVTVTITLPFPSPTTATVEQVAPTSTELGYFVPGQTPHTFWAQGGSVWLSPVGVHLTLDQARLDISFANANPDVALTGTHPLDIQVHTFLGNDPAQWQGNTPVYGQIVYHQLYQGIDLTYRFLNGALKSEFHVAPGSDPRDIQVAYAHGAHLSVDNGGRNLHIVTPEGQTLDEEIPEAYQIINGRRHAVEVRFNLVNASTYTFAIQGAYDPHAPLVIDPVLLYATYFGGSSIDEGWSIATDQHGSTYIAGITMSPEAPFGISIGPVSNPRNVLVARFDPNGKLAYVTILGGSDGEEGNGIGVDAEGNAYVTGQTFSDDFPIKDAWQSQFLGHEDTYLTKLDPNGNLVFSTYFGGTGGEEVDDIYVDAAGNAYLGGEVYSDDYPLLNPWSSQGYGDTEEDGFLTIFSAEGTLLYSTLFSASERDQVFRLTVDREGYVYGTGMTSSDEFPTVNALQATYGGGYDDCFVFKFDPWQNRMLYATFLGGIDRDECWGIAVDQDGAAYVTGFTTSPDFPTVQAYQSEYSGNSDVFVTKLSPPGDRLIFSTFIGTQQSEFGKGLAVDSAGNVYVTGFTRSPSFLNIDALQPHFGGEEDGFVLAMMSDGTPRYASYLGGSGQDQGQRITVDKNWVVHVTGFTNSTDLQLAAPVQRPGGKNDAFIARFGLIPTPTPTPTPTPYATTQMDADGGVIWLTWPEHLTVMHVDYDVFNVPMDVTLTYAGYPDVQGELTGINHFFSIKTAPSPDGDPITQFNRPVQLKLGFPTSNPLINGTLNLYWLGTQGWVTDTITTTSVAPGYLAANITRTGIYGILGESRRVYLPLMLRK